MQSSHVHDVNKYNVHVSKAMILKVRYKLKYCMIQFANKKSLLHSSPCLSLHQFIFFQSKEILQKG